MFAYVARPYTPMCRRAALTRSNAFHLKKGIGFERCVGVSWREEAWVYMHEIFKEKYYLKYSFLQKAAFQLERHHLLSDLT